MVNKLGGRKAIIGVSMIILGVVIDFSFGLSANLLQLITFITVGFFLGNAGEHLAKSRKPKPEEDPVNQNLVNSHNIINQRLDGMEKEIKNINELAGTVEKNIEVSNKALSSVIDLLRAGGSR